MKTELEGRKGKALFFLSGDGQDVSFEWHFSCFITWQHITSNQSENFYLLLTKQTNSNKLLISVVIYMQMIWAWHSIHSHF